MAASCHDQKDSELSEVENLQTQAVDCIHNKNFVEATSLLTRAIQISDDYSLDEELFKSKVALANCYYLMNNYPEAYSILVDSYALAKDRLDDRSQFYALGNLAIINFEQGDMDNAGDAFLKIIDYACRTGNSMLKSGALGNLALVKAKKKDYGTAIELIDSSLRCLPLERHRRKIETLHVKADILQQTGDYNAALRVLAVCDSLLPAESDALIKEENMLLKAKCHFGKNNFDEAETFAMPLMSSEDAKTRIEVFNLLEGIEKSRGNYEKGLYYADRLTSQKDSLANEKLRLAHHSNKVRLEFAEAQSSLRTQPQRNNIMGIDSSRSTAAAGSCKSALFQDAVPQTTQRS